MTRVWTLGQRSATFLAERVHIYTRWNTQTHAVEARTPAGLKFYPTYKLTHCLPWFHGCGRRQETPELETESFIAHDNSSSQSITTGTHSPRPHSPRAMGRGAGDTNSGLHSRERTQSSFSEYFYCAKIHITFTILTSFFFIFIHLF